MEKKDLLREAIAPCDTTKPYVFVSYSKLDGEQVYETVVRLQRDGYNIWIDKELESAAGLDWQMQALKAMRACECKEVLFFVSEHSVCSVPVCAELYFSQSKTVQMDHDDKPLKILPIVTTGQWNPGEKPFSEWIQKDVYSGVYKGETLKDNDYLVLRAIGVGNQYLKKEPVPRLAYRTHIARFLCDNVLKKKRVDQLTFAYNKELKTIKKNISEDCLNLPRSASVLNETAPVLARESAPATAASKGSDLQPVAVEPVEHTMTAPVLADEPVSKDRAAKKEKGEKKTLQREEFQPEPVTPFSLPDGGAVTIGAVRARMAEDLEFCKRLGEIRRTELAYGGKSYMDYGMAAVLKGCNKVVEPYQMNYYNYCVANPDKVSTAKIAATWTWSSNARKVIGFVGSGMLDSKINALFESFPESMTVNELLSNFQKCSEEAYITKKNSLVIDGIQKLLNAYYS